MAGLNERISPRVFKCATFASVATNSSARLSALVFPVAGEIVGGYWVNGTTSTLSSASTTGSAYTIKVYKTASNSGSTLASMLSQVVGTVGTNAAAALTMNTATKANARIAAGGLVVVEQIGGVGNNENVAGSFVVLNYVLGLEDGATPSAGTGPA